VEEHALIQTEAAAAELEQNRPQPISEGAAPDTQRTDSFTLSADDTALLDSYFGVNVRMAILKLHEKVLLNPKAKPGSLGSVYSEPITDRQLRGKLHQVVIA
jgi:hypothetical protein